MSVPMKDTAGRETEEAFACLFPYLVKAAGKPWEALRLVTRGTGAASGKQGFPDGFTAAGSQIYGKEADDEQGSV